MQTLHFAVMIDAQDAATIGDEFDRLVGILRQLGYPFDDGRSAGLSSTQPAILWHDRRRDVALGLAEQGGSFLVSVAAHTAIECNAVYQVIADRMPVVPLDGVQDAASMPWSQVASTNA